MNKDTVSMHFVVAAVARLGRVDREHALRVAGIPEALLVASEARVPASTFAALWLAIAHRIDDEFFGLDRRRMKVGSFALLCHAVLPSETLERALRQLLRGFATVLDDIEAGLSLEGSQAVVTLSNRIADPGARRFADETFLVMVHGLMCWLTGRRIALASAAFAHPRPAHAHEYEVMFSQHLSFDAPVTAIRFEAGLLQLPVVQNVGTIKPFLRTAPQSVFLKYKNENGWTARVRRRLRAGFGNADWPVLDALASEFYLTPTTLRRRLDAEGSSYQGIKDALRRDAAIHHLCATELSIADIGRLLGFQEPSAFHRAFKRWSGVQPGLYRRKPPNADADAG